MTYGRGVLTAHPALGPFLRFHHLCSLCKCIGRAAARPTLGDPQRVWPCADGVVSLDFSDYIHFISLFINSLPCATKDTKGALVLSL